MLEDIAVLDSVEWTAACCSDWGAAYQRYEFHKFGLDSRRVPATHFLESPRTSSKQFLPQTTRSPTRGRYIRIPEDLQQRASAAVPAGDLRRGGWWRDSKTQQRAARSGYTALNSAGGMPMEAVLANRSIIEAAPPGGRQ